MRKLTTTNIQLAVWIARLGSFTAAADRMHTTQPAVSARVKELEQENRDLQRANEILKRAASFFGAELDRQHKK